jgi:transcriptional regulator with XRE-family HTH domain
MHKGLSQAAVGEHFNISYRSVSQWELGQTRPAEDRIRSLCALYGVSASWLENPVSMAIETKGITGEMNAQEAGDQAMAYGSALAQDQQNQPDLATVDRPGRPDIFVSYRSNPDNPEGGPELTAGPDIVIIKEIHEQHWKPSTRDLRTLPVTREWFLPRALLVNTVDPNSVRIMRITQDVVAPLIQVGEYVFLDCSVTELAGTSWLYVMTDGLTNFMRRAETTHDDDGEPVYMLKAENPGTTARKVKPPNLRVLGRVIGTVRIFN